MGTRGNICLLLVDLWYFGDDHHSGNVDQPCWQGLVLDVDGPFETSFWWFWGEFCKCRVKYGQSIINWVEFMTSLWLVKHGQVYCQVILMMSTQLGKVITFAQDKYAITAIEAILPVNASTFAPFLECWHLVVWLEILNLYWTVGICAKKSILLGPVTDIQDVSDAWTLNHTGISWDLSGPWAPHTCYSSPHDASGRNSPNSQPAATNRESSLARLRLLLCHHPSREGGAWLLFIAHVHSVSDFICLQMSAKNVWCIKNVYIYNIYEYITVYRINK